MGIHWCVSDIICYYVLFDCEVVMFALNRMDFRGRLRRSALDKVFSSVVMMYLDRHGLLAVYGDTQQGYVSYYHSNWSPC